MKPLTEQHRPRQLAEIAGQPVAVAAVKNELRTKASFAVIATGKPGVGKTSLAHAIAGELGCQPWEKGGGFRVVESNRQGVDLLAETFASQAFRPLIGSRWRVVCFEECELKSKAAVNYLKTALERLPEHCVIVFTSNASIEDFADDAIAERCLCLTFEHDAEKLAADAQALVSRVWESTLGRNHAPTLAELGIPTTGRLSFRQVLSALEPALLAQMPDETPSIEFMESLPIREEWETAAEFEVRADAPPVVDGIAIEPVAQCPAPEPTNTLETVTRYKRDVFGGRDDVILYTDAGHEYTVSSDEFDAMGGIAAARAGTMVVNPEEIGVAA